MAYKYTHGTVRFLNGNGQTHNVTFGYEEPTPPEPVQPVRLPSHSGHPLLIVGLIIGALFGIIAALPASIRGWVVLAIIGGIIWFGWNVIHDANGPAYTGTDQPVAAAAQTPYSFDQESDVHLIPNK